MNPRHPVIQTLAEAIWELREVAPDLTMADAGTLSSYQVQLGEIIFQIVQTAKTLQDIEDGP